MGLYYPQQHIKELVGSKNPTSFEIVASTLTSSYTGNSKIITSDYMSVLTLYIKYTVGAGGGGNYINLKLEYSSDGINFYQENTESHSKGSTIQYIKERKFDNNGSTVALTTYSIKISVPLADKYFRFSAKEVVVGGSYGTLYAEAIVSGK